MFSIKLIDWSTRHQNQELLEQYFRLRHEIYVHKRGWSDVARPIAMEIDAFDNQDAVYLIGVDANGDIKAGSRLVPTLKPHLLASVFPELAPGCVPRSANIIEWTRFFVAPELRSKGEPSLAAGIMLCGLLEYTLVNQLTAISVVCEAFWPNRLEKLGWNVLRLGPVFPHKDGDIVALLITVQAETLASTRAAYGLPERKFLLPAVPCVHTSVSVDANDPSISTNDGEDPQLLSVSGRPSPTLSG